MRTIYDISPQVTAAERDEILAMRNRSDAALDNSELKLEELHLTLEETRGQLHNLSLEYDAIDQAAQKAARVAAQNERFMHLQLERSLTENGQLRETTVAAEREKAEQALLELQKERAEIERLDAENVRITRILMASLILRNPSR